MNKIKLPTFSKIERIAWIYNKCPYDFFEDASLNEWMLELQHTIEAALKNEQSEK